MDAIRAAEEAYLRVKELGEISIARAVRAHIITALTFGVVGLGIAIPFIFVSAMEPNFINVALLILGVGLGLAGLTTFAFAGESEKDKIRTILLEHAEVIAQVKKTFVEAHGIELPEGAFASLRFPLLISSEPKTHGTAEVLLKDTGELATILLKSSPEMGYSLYGTDGRRLASLTPELA